ncbi:hypothetical protein LINPERPRIM_LOCUS32980 [Linum perenne]
MAHKHCIESLDRTLRDVMSRRDKTNADVPFGGITVVFGGDFRQTLPIIPKATRTQIINSSIKRSYLWQYMIVIRLTENLIIDNKEDPVVTIVEETYTQLSENIGNADYFAKRAILAPFHEIVSQINNYMLDQSPGEEMCYYSYDSIQSDCVNPSTAEEEFPVEFLNSLQIGNFPDHQKLEYQLYYYEILIKQLDCVMVQE